MADNDKIGYASPPKSTRWRKGQSGNPRGRPKSKSEMMTDAAKILTEPVEARGRDGKIVRLDAIEAGFLSLCKKGLKGHRASLIEAIRIMLEVGPAVEAQATSEEAEKQEIIDMLESMGVKLSLDA